MQVHSAAENHAPPVRIAISITRLQNGLLWLLIASSSIVLVEPAPYDALFIVTFVIFALTGLKLSYRVVPLIVLVILFNLGGAFSLLPYLDEPISVMFTIVSFYLGFSAIVFSGIITDDPQARIDIIRKAWIFAGLIASVCGIAGYFGIAGAADHFTRFGRASGTFKDPNVLGPFLTVPAVLIIQGFMSGSLKRPLLSLFALLILLGGVFFSFSRGAWGVMVGSGILTGALLFVTSGSTTIRMRIIVITVAGVVLLAIALAAILSIDSVRQIFELRFSLLQDYDTGAQGRFGNVLHAIPRLLERPNGFGPQRFPEVFSEAPHDVYVNAFSSYGWLGGISYFCLIALTVRIGWATVWRRTPWQAPYIALWSVTFCQILQGFQIDSDHWRHLWLLIGLTWGLAAVASQDRSRRHAASQSHPSFPQRSVAARPASALSQH
jgi:hypothetical protein